MSEDSAAEIAAPSGLASSAPGPRILSVDCMRGLVMVVMGLDHSREFLTNLPFAPEDMAHTWPALFFTRWVTHFCAPLFFFLAGTGASLYRRRVQSSARTAHFLWTRGIWLIVLEFTIIEYAWTFTFWQMGGVIWSLGCCMILLALLTRLPDNVTLAVGAAIVLFHDCFDSVSPAAFGRFAWAWALLHRKGVLPHTEFFVLFPLLPWLGVMALGYAFGRLFDKPVVVRSRIMLWLGSLATAAFLLLRLFNAYGNPTAAVAQNSPGEWHMQSTIAMSVVSFLNLEKYPASLQFLLMTLGPSLILFSLLERLFSNKEQAGGASRFARWSSPLLVFGRVPLLFYILHLYAIHFAAILLAKLFHQPADWLWKGGFWMNEKPPAYGHGLPFVYLTWAVLVLLLYFPCAWFAGYRRRHPSWWLSYL